MLHCVLEYYEPVMAGASVAIWLGVRYWNRRHAANVPSLAPIAIFWSLLNYANLEYVQRSLLTVRLWPLITAKLWRGDSELLSFAGALVAVMCGHIALVQMRKRGTTRPLRIVTRVALLCAYPYLIYWSLILLAWLRYAWIMHGYHGP